MITRGTAWRVAVVLVALLAGCASNRSLHGYLALRQGKYEDAIAQFEKALETEPDHVEALVGLGIARFKLGEMEGAIESLDRAVAWPSPPRVAHFYLGLAHLRQQEDEAAKQHLATYVKLTGDAGVAPQVGRTLKLMEGGALTDAVREYVAASLDDAADALDVIRDRAKAAPGGESENPPGGGGHGAGGRGRKAPRQSPPPKK